MRTTTLILALGIAVALLISPSYAGPLASHPDAVDSATGSQLTSSGGLNVTVEYAVLEVDDFNDDFSGLGYTPTPGQLVYAYQVINNDPPSTVDVTTQIILPADPAGNIGSFNIGDVAPGASTFIGTQATWFFFSAITPGQTSYGLAFSSPNAPVLDFSGSLTVGVGGASVVAAVHVPGDDLYVPAPIPEPSTVAMLGLGGLALVGLRRRRSA